MPQRGPRIEPAHTDRVVTPYNQKGILMIHDMFKTGLFLLAFSGAVAVSLMGAVFTIIMVLGIIGGDGGYWFPLVAIFAVLSVIFWTVAIKAQPYKGKSF